MAKTSIIDKLKFDVSKVGFKIQQHSPEILLVTGIVGMVGSAVAACVATRKLGDVLEDANQDMDDVNKDTECEMLTEEESSQEKRSIQVRTGLNIVKLYSPAVGIGVFSIACILSSNGILRKRSAALAAAYATVDQAFQQYRERVVDRYGEDVDRELRYGTHREEIEEEVQDEKGRTKKVKKEVEVLDKSIDGYSPYARIYDSQSRCWTKSSDYNLKFLTEQESFLNRKFRARGYMFLNEVYEELGYEDKTEAGQVVGWIFDEKNPTGDNYISFGIYDGARQKNEDFIDGYENVIILDFNVDGPIIEPLMKRGLLGKV